MLVILKSLYYPRGMSTQHGRDIDEDGYDALGASQPVTPLDRIGRG